MAAKGKESITQHVLHNTQYSNSEETDQIDFFEAAFLQGQKPVYVVEGKLDELPAGGFYTDLYIAGVVYWMPGKEALRVLRA